MIELKFTDNESFLEDLYRAIDRFQNLGFYRRECNFIIMHQKIKFDIFYKSKNPPQYTVPGPISISPTGELKIFGIRIISSTDIKEDIIFVV